MDLYTTDFIKSRGGDEKGIEWVTVRYSQQTRDRNQAEKFLSYQLYPLASIVLGQCVATTHIFSKA